MPLFSNLLGRIFRDTPRSDATRSPTVGNIQQQKESLKAGFIPVISSWVAGMRFVPYGQTATGDLYVKFRSGVICKYQSIAHDLYDDFFSSSSKGRFVHEYLKHLPYTIVSSVFE